MNLFTEVPTLEPSAIFAGDTLAWKRPDLAADYAPGTYSLTYSFRKDGSGATTFSLSSTAADFLISASAATTGAYSAGRYRWSAVIIRVSDSAKITVATGTMEVLPNKASATDDPRTHARKMLDAIEALMEGRSVTDISNYSIQGRALTRMSVEELIKWRGFYRNEVKREEDAEKIAKGLSTGRRVLTRFTGN